MVGFSHIWQNVLPSPNLTIFLFNTVNIRETDSGGEKQMDKNADVAVRGGQSERRCNRNAKITTSGNRGLETGVSK